MGEKVALMAANYGKMSKFASKIFILIEIIDH